MSTDSMYSGSSRRSFSTYSGSTDSQVPDSIRRLRFQRPLGPMTDPAQLRSMEGMNSARVAPSPIDVVQPHLPLLPDGVPVAQARRDFLNNRGVELNCDKKCRLD